MKTEAPRRRARYSSPEEADRAWKEYLKEYVKANQKNIQIRLNKQKDADVIARIESQPNKADYIRRLVRADME